LTAEQVLNTYPLERLRPALRRARAA
jgi:hypothetical protein